MIIDTHTHLYLPEFNDDDSGATAVKRAIEAGVTRMILPNVDLTTIGPLHDLCDRFPENLYPAMGLHPTELSDDTEAQLLRIEELLTSPGAPRYVAVGEIGMDLYWDRSREKDQAETFRRQAALAARLGLPVIIHCREALPQTLEVLASLPEVPRGVFHSFTGTPADVDAIRAVGDFYFGINGIVTFKKSTLPATLPHIGIDRILLETDSPYLAPVPYRGKRNESAYIVHTAAAVASALGMTIKQVEDITTANAIKLFALK